MLYRHCIVSNKNTKYRTYIVSKEKNVSLKGGGDFQFTNFINQCAFESSLHEIEIRKIDHNLSLAIVQL